jgi:dipeptidyl aminopeptidase/acylaminoacyl peptidase
MNKLAASILLLLTLQAGAQTSLAPLSVEKIMRDPQWIGSSPSNPFWSNDGKKLYFSWNPDKAPSDSLYFITLGDKTPIKASIQEKAEYNATGLYVYNKARTSFVYSKNGDIYLADTKSGRIKQITQTTEQESNPQFGFNETKIVYYRNQNLYSWDPVGGETVQLTNIKTGEAAAAPVTGGPQRGTMPQAAGRAAANPQEQWLQNDQLSWFQVLKDRKVKREQAENYTKSLPKTKELRSINLEDKFLQGLTISPDGRFISYRLLRTASSKTTVVPSYVTETGFTVDLPSRSKVGSGQGISEMFIYDREKDTIYSIKTDSVPGIKDIPAYVKDYPKQLEEKTKKPATRGVSFGQLSWSPLGNNAVLEIRSLDYKDRWLMKFDRLLGTFTLLDRQHDEAWIGGPGTGGFGGSTTGWIDENTFWFRSEVSGYSHIYLATINTGGIRALTSGNYEVQQAQLSLDKKFFYISTNEVHPGEQHFYRLSIADGKKERITTKTGAHQVAVSPDEKWLADIYSYSTQPWELFLRENKAGGKEEQLTFKAKSDEFSSYNWKDPEVISFTARDGAPVYARVYKPANPHPNKPAVLFVHGAGYLQNAHKWWSSYFREYMFNNLLADQGYYVMDIDYRGSAGYGRDWRTGIYRYMGGKDLSDHVDAVNYLVKNYGVNPSHVGLYGGSYGGFITLMGMFTEPDVFAAGAALRPVTDWANYNHGYTASILNEPFTDSIAYRRSSPLYFAEGLKGNLLICHGMMDLNVHYQDAVKLAQRLIELGKDKWELASYPMEDHGFVEPSSWTDEYKRIYRLFESVLKK